LVRPSPTGPFDAPLAPQRRHAYAYDVVYETMGS
jgi:hypothetical protein